MKLKLTHIIKATKMQYLLPSLKTFKEKQASELNVTASHRCLPQQLWVYPLFGNCAMCLG